jgi:hypothetical protein
MFTSYNAAAASELALGRFRAEFGGRDHVDLSFLQVTEQEQALRDVQATRESGIHGVLLENAGIGYQRLMWIGRQAVLMCPGFFVGVKCRDLRPQDVFCRLPRGVRGVWADDAADGGAAGATGPVVRAARASSGWAGLYFGAFTPRDEMDRTGLPVASALIDGRDVLVIASSGRDQPVSVETVREIREAIGLHPLAIMTEDPATDMGDYLPYIDCVVVR